MPTPISGLNPQQLVQTSGHAATHGAKPQDGPAFLDTFKDAMQQVGQLQNEADTRVTQLMSGNGQDVHSAMIAVEKASLAFEMMVQVRNKIVQAYQQVAGMQF